MLTAAFAVLILLAALAVALAWALRVQADARRWRDEAINELGDLDDRVKAVEQYQAKETTWERRLADLERRFGSSR